MYLMSFHRTFIGVSHSGELVQLRSIKANLARFVSIKSIHDPIASGPLADYKIERSPRGLSFIKDGKYLCAEKDGATLHPNRQSRLAWETFAVVDDNKVANFMEDENKGDADRFGSVVAKLRDEGKPVKIFCGAGTVPRPGFLNLDITAHALDFYVSNFDEYFIFPFADGPWNLPDNCVDYIFHEDFIEHITQLMQFQFLAETLRVLKPGCWHRVNTPNVLAAMKRHSNFSRGFAGVYTGETQWDHIAIFSPSSLKEAAELVGYREVVFTTRNHGVSPFAERDHRPGPDRDEILGNIYADLLK